MKRYNCKTCGAELYFDAATQKLKCEYCDSMFEPAEYDDVDGAGVDDNTRTSGFADDIESKKRANAADNDRSKEELNAADDTGDTVTAGAGMYTDGAGGDRQQPEMADADAHATDDSDGALVVYKCSHCGAEIITSKNTVATTCIYCNRAVVLEGNISGEWKPDYVIPFAKQREDVEEAYRKLCKSTFLAPKLFKEENTVKKLKGVYIPFWLHSMHVEADLQATAKKYRVWMAGDIEYTEVKTYHIERSASGDFDKIPADALVKMDNKLMDAIEPFDYSNLKSFHPAYLAGYYTERFDEPAEKTKARADERAKECMHDRMMEGLDGYSSVSVNQEKIRFSGEKAEYGMLPVWMMYTEYKGKNYIFGMNGQTGKMIGEIPKDYKKAALITACVFFGSQLIMMLIRLIGGLL